MNNYERMFISLLSCILFFLCDHHNWSITLFFTELMSLDFLLTLIGNHNDFGIWKWGTKRYIGLFLFHCCYSPFSFFCHNFIGNFFPVYSSLSNTSLPFQAIYNGSLNNLEWSLQAHNLLTPIGSLLQVHSSISQHRMLWLYYFVLAIREIRYLVFINFFSSLKVTIGLLQEIGILTKEDDITQILNCPL